MNLRDPYSVLEEAHCPNGMFDLLDEKYQAEAINRARRLGQCVQLTEYDRILLEEFLAAYSALLDAHENLIDQRETREPDESDDEPR